MEFIWDIEEDSELPGRSLTYLRRQGLSEPDAVAAIAAEFDLDLGAATALAADAA